MYLFCPTCGNLLIVEEGPSCYRFACNTCPYVQNITEKVSSKTGMSVRAWAIPASSTELLSPRLQVSTYQFPRLKEVDDVLGGQAAWENVDTTDGGLMVFLLP